MSRKSKKPQFRTPLSEAEYALKVVNWAMFWLAFWLIFGVPVLSIISRVLR